MTHKLLQEVRTAKIAVSNTIDLPLKIAYTLLKLSGGYVDKTSRRKLAMKPDQINRAVVQHFQDRELVDPPDIDFGKLISNAVANMARKAGMTYEQGMEMTLSITQNLLVGMNLDNGNVYSQGDLANRIREMRAKGKTDKDMKYILADWVQKTFLTKTRYDRRREYSGHDNAPADSKRETLSLFEEVLSFNPLSRSEASQWMGISQKDPVLRLLLKQIDRVISQKAGVAESLVWQTVRENPDYPSISQLAREIVTVEDPTTKRPTSLPLEDALTMLQDAGLVKSNNVRYILEKKVMPMLDRLKPAVLEALREKEQG